MYFFICILYRYFGIIYKRKVYKNFIVDLVKMGKIFENN